MLAEAGVVRAPQLDTVLVMRHQRETLQERSQQMELQFVLEIEKVNDTLPAALRSLGHSESKYNPPP